MRQQGLAARRTAAGPSELANERMVLCTRRVRGEAHSSHMTYPGPASIATPSASCVRFVAISTVASRQREIHAA